jgi:hypothetical protein
MNPEVRVEQEKTQRGDKPERWRIAWLIENLGAAPLKILAARAPHGKFRCDEKEFTPPVELAANQRGRIELKMQCGEAEGAEIENAFLILRVLYADSRWLILARLRVYVAEEGRPVTTSELITAQPVGFSARL